MITHHISELEKFETMQKELNISGAPLYAGHILHYAAKKHSKKIALIYKDRSISYAELYTFASRLTTFLKKQGVSRGMHVLMCFENCIEFYISYYAIWQAGAVIIPVSTFLSVHELTHILEDAHPVLIIADDQHLALFQETGLNNLPRIISTTDITSVCVDETYSIEDPCEPLPENNPCLLLYTSGTTGTPKGVMLSSKNIMTNVMQAIARFGFIDQERLFGILPLFHVFAQNTCVWSSIFSGSTIIIINKIERRLLLDGLKHKPTIFLGVPALYGLLCLLRPNNLDTVSYFVSGGDALPDRIRSLFSLIYGRKIINGYGLTETSPVIAVDFDDELTYSNTVGRPVAALSCSIRDKNNQEVAQGEIGQLWVKGDNIMLGYHNAPKATQEAIVDGWFNTGDCAFINNQGKIVITGREKDLIINKGLNIYPQEIENILLSFPGVVRAAVIGKEDEHEGEIPIAFIQVFAEIKNCENELRNYCLQHIAKYKIPRLFLCQTEELPMTTTNKIDKKRLREIIKKI